MPAPLSRPSPRLLTLLLVPLALASLASDCSGLHEPLGRMNFASPQSNPIVLSHDGSRLFVANTTSNSVSVVDTRHGVEIAEISVGLEPVGLALSPDDRTLLVANHVSDTVSVVDVRRFGRTRNTVVATIQDLDANGVTRFDEPVGVVFASDEKAYVSLSSRNDIAILDLTNHSVAGRIHISAQEPRALAVRGGYLYVPVFESGNQTEVSVCPNDPYSSPQCTLGPLEIGDFITIPNLPGREKNIVVDPDVPDRDVYVIDVATDQIVDVVDGVGTLLYGVAVSSQGEVFITQTDARNAENGLEGQNLVDLENRIFDNQIGRLSCVGGVCTKLAALPLEPPLPAQPAAGQALATPYGVALSADDSTLLATAAGTSRLFSLDAGTGNVLDVVDLGAPAGQQIPKGVALDCDASGAPETAYVLNTLENTVSVVDVSNPANLVHLSKIEVGRDRTPEEVRLGRIAFNNALASDSGTFSCGSCHPDGNMDQLLWRIGGACFFDECTGDDEARSTMPVRGLERSIPLHWDGTLGDPFGGINGAFGPNIDVPPNCTDEHSCFRQLVDASLSGVMCDQAGGCAAGPTGLPGLLTEAERENMAFFLAKVTYPPARERAVDDTLSASAVEGFGDFFLDHGGIGSIGQTDSCSDMNSGCHALPLLTSHSSVTLQGFDPPTLRGLNDRFLQFSLGMTGAEEALEGAVIGGTIPFLGGLINLTADPSPRPYSFAEGMEEEVTFAASFAAFTDIYNVGPLDIFQMVQEMSTGYSGAIGRQVTLSEETAGAGQLAQTEALVAALEQADEEGAVNLRADGRRKIGFGWGPGIPVLYSYRLDAEYPAGAYVPLVGEALSRAELIAAAAAGDLTVTLTAGLPSQYGKALQPLLAPINTGRGAIGNPDIPLLPAAHPISVRGLAVRDGSAILVDGDPVGGSISCDGGSFDPECTSEVVTITLDVVPTTTGMHTLQVQSPSGPFSNELPMCVGTVRADCL